MVITGIALRPVVYVGFLCIVIVAAFSGILLNSQQTLGTSEGRFCGSKNSNVYHYPTCTYAKRIDPKNLIWFTDECDAKSKGYRPCSICDPPACNAAQATSNATATSTQSTILPTPTTTPTPTPSQTPSPITTPAATESPSTPGKEMTSTPTLATTPISASPSGGENLVVPVASLAAIGVASVYVLRTRRPRVKFEIYKDNAGKFRWRLKASNGEEIAFGEGYESREGCMKGVESVKYNTPRARIVDMTEKILPTRRH
jgi:uncharacterized protein YegP (UPF0339 family)